MEWTVSNKRDPKSLIERDSLISVHTESDVSLSHCNNMDTGLLTVYDSFIFYYSYFLSTPTDLWIIPWKVDYLAQCLACYSQQTRFNVILFLGIPSRYMR